MGRGKIEIKLIENSTNRQVTYSKRRNGIVKKATELAVLCDAKVSLLMFSDTGKLHEYTSPNTTTKKIYDQYQSVKGIDLWSTHYKRMEENLRRLKEINYNLRREIRQRIGKDLNDLDYKQLHNLEQNISSPLKAIRERKYHVINNQTQTFKKKVANLQQIHGDLLHSEAKYESAEYELRGNGRDLLHSEAKYESAEYELRGNGRDYHVSAVEMVNGATNLHAFRLHHNHTELSSGGGFLSHDLRHLRLA